MPSKSRKYLKFLFGKTNALILIAIVGSVLLFAGGPDYFSPRSFKEIWNLGHVLLFSAMSFLILIGLSKKERMTFLSQAFTVIFIALFLGILIEMAQEGSRRSPDALDVIRNVIGCLLSLSFFAPSRKTISNLCLRSLQVATLLLVAAALFPVAKSIADEIVALKQFPVLSDFETPFEIDRWEGNSKISLAPTVSFHGQASMKVVLNTSHYSGVSLKYFPGNWLHFKYLQLCILNPDSDPVQITCRIHDMRHAEGVQAYNDRFNKTYVLQKGWNLIEIPLEQVEKAPQDRKLNLGRVQEVGIFAHRLRHSRAIYIDNVRLANRGNDQISSRRNAEKIVNDNPQLSCKAKIPPSRLTTELADNVIAIDPTIEFL